MRVERFGKREQGRDHDKLNEREILIHIDFNDRRMETLIDDFQNVLIT